MEELTFSIPTDIFEQIRETWKKYGILDDEAIAIIKKLLKNWCKKKPYGIKIEKQNGIINEGMCWHAYIEKGYLIYFLEKYKKPKIIVKPYRVPLREIKKIEYLGRSSTIRPLPSNIHIFSVCS